MSPLEITFIVIGSIVGYASIATFLSGFLVPLTKWNRFDEVLFAIFWPVSWIFLLMYPGEALGKKTKAWLKKRAEEQEKQERVRIAEEKRQRIELEEIERELEEEERLRRNMRG